MSDATDQILSVSHGGYFLLPELRDAAHENATIVFNTPTRGGSNAVEWKVRIDDRQTLTYAEFAKALDEAGSVQRKIPFDRSSMREVHMVEYDKLRACFRSSDGRVIDGGKPATRTAEGNCQVLKLDAAATSANSSEIAFVGPRDVVTLNRINI